MMSEADYIEKIEALEAALEESEQAYRRLEEQYEHSLSECQKEIRRLRVVVRELNEQLREGSL